MREGATPSSQIHTIFLSLKTEISGSHLPVATRLLVASGLAPRWAAQQPQNQALRSVRYTAFVLIGGASHPNAGQARSPQRFQVAARG
ncbi:hypothetical protein TU75_16355 [Pseudomonas poae]|nr:hypothetical protein TU75_16355 [Pseudomonas poae]